MNWSFYIRIPEDWKRSAAAIPLDDEVIRSGAHLLAGVRPLDAAGRPAAEWLWRQPAVTVLSTTFPRPGEWAFRPRSR